MFRKLPSHHSMNCGLFILRLLFGLKNFLLVLLFVLGPVFISIAQKRKPYHVYWEKERKLTWNDFNLKEGKGILHNAFIFAYPKRDKDKSSIGIYTVFHKKHSWVTPHYLDNDTLLRYFQIRFDIIELYARKARKAAYEIVQDDALTNKWLNIKKAFNNIMDDGIKEVKRFDEESEEGKNKAVVMQKSIEVSQELDKLKRYSANNISF